MTLLKPEPSRASPPPRVSVPQKAALGKEGVRRGEEKTLASFGAILVKRGVNNSSPSHCIPNSLHCTTRSIGEEMALGDGRNEELMDILPPSDSHVPPSAAI